MMAYTFPDYIVIKEDGYSRSETSRFTSSAPAAGQYFSQIISDDAPIYFTLSLVAKNHADALNFRQWLVQQNYDILNGAQFDIELWTEYGMTVQRAAFVPDGTPQLTQTIRNVFLYSARIVVPRPNILSGPILTEDRDGIETEDNKLIYTEGRIF